MLASQTRLTRLIFWIQVAPVPAIMLNLPSEVVQLEVPAFSLTVLDLAAAAKPASGQTRWQAGDLRPVKGSILRRSWESHLAGNPASLLIGIQ